ncbi:MAG: hypothetical protein CMB64_00950 [Euryarchaeota archaeon]|nr:hypothetical protein [Euryarchaeota archaeon]|tara:strand:+ start:653 stop:1126 length:474 start_codon:yes stop_codon:yes gene_type:complete
MKRNLEFKNDENAAATELGYVFTFLLGLLLLSLYSIWAWDIENATRERWSEVALTENVERVGNAIERADAVARINLNATYSENIELLSVEQTSANVIIILDEESLTIVHPNFKENFEYKITSAAPTSHVGELNIKGESSIWVHLSNGIVEISDKPAN